MDHVPERVALEAQVEAVGVNVAVMDDCVVTEVKDVAEGGEGDDEDGVARGRREPAQAGGRTVPRRPKPRRDAERGGCLGHSPQAANAHHEGRSEHEEVEVPPFPGPPVEEWRE